jgi:uncharacterized membrane protein
MFTIETSIEIRRPVEAVFAFVADPHNEPLWERTVQEARVTPDGPPAVGTRVTKVGSFLGLKLEVTNEITALEPNRELGIKGISGPASASMEGTFRFEAVGESTRLSFISQIETGGLFKMAGPLLASQARKQVEADLQRLKELLEAQG